MATDFTVALSARWALGTSGTYGVLFGINEDWMQYYEVIIEGSSYSIWRYDGGWTALKAWTSSEAIHTGAAWNRLKVIRDGANISVTINDQHLTTVADSAFTGLRRIGLIVLSPGSGSADAHFDDFSLYPASCGDDAVADGVGAGQRALEEAPAPRWVSHPGLPCGGADASVGPAQ
jgi:hypothetical protein